MDFTSLPSASSIDPVNDLLAIANYAGNVSQGINRNTFLGIVSAPVGLTDTQTLTNKTITSPTISGPTLSGTIIGTYTIGGTPTFPSSVTTLTGTQTLTNKTIAAASNTISGLTNSNLSGSAGITSANLASSLTLTTPTIAENLNPVMSLNGNPVWQYLGYAQITTNSTTASPTPVVGSTQLAISVTVPSGTTKLKISVYTVSLATNSTLGNPFMYLYSGASAGTLTTLLQQADGAAGSTSATLQWISASAPSAGSIAYTVAISNNGSYTTTLTGGPNYPAYILVECC